MSDYLSVAEAAAALGTSPQTVRTLLRKGELRGRKRAWGTRYVWMVSREAVNEFLAQYGRLDGRHRPRPQVAETVALVPSIGLAQGPPAGVPSPPRPDSSQPVPDTNRSAWRPFFLRPRGRATVVVVVLGVPLLAAYAAARILPGFLWFDELGQEDVYGRVLAARVEFYVLVMGTVSLFTWANLAIALRRTELVSTRAAKLGAAAASLMTGSMFASSVEGHWQTHLLWQHRQTFGVVDPMYGKDVGFFVFTLPFERLVLELLLWLVAVATLYVALVYRARGALRFRPRHATFPAQLHLAGLASTFLLVVAWRFRLEQYLLELGQPSPDSNSFAGAGYVDVNVRLPGLIALSAVAACLAFACMVAPLLARRGRVRPMALLAGIPAALLVALSLAEGLIPALVQRYAVDPSPLAREQPFLERSLAGTRSGLGLDAIDVEPYSPAGSFSAADFPPARKRLADVLIWDTSLLEARMRQLVTNTPYYRPEEPMLDDLRLDGRRKLTVVSARELNLRRVGGAADTWTNNRLAYTHGLGLIRYSGTAIEQSRGPRLIDAGLRVRQPRIYFGNFSQGRVGANQGDEPSILTRTRDQRIAQSPWVLVDTRRPEIDIPSSEGAPRGPYHYRGTGGIELSNWTRRALFAFALGSKELVLSDDITPQSRILLHRDIRDRLHTLAPFLQWDSNPVTLTANGHIVFVVDGYTTSAFYPYAERVDLGETNVNYARASVRATVDAYSGRVNIYLTDTADPIVRAWAEIFPTLFHPEEEMPAELRRRLRYPQDLFDAQAAAYETFHTTRPDVYVSDADVWSRPITLSGSLEVAGDVNFDESDEDNLRATMGSSYTYSPPPGKKRPQISLVTYYSPRRGQNMVATLTGWIDEQGRARLAARSLPRDPVTLGPAQISRLVFATPRVRNLLGLRNLEVGDLNKSSLDAVILGQPHLLFLPGGIIQIQSLYEGSRGPGAARLLGVTAFLNGRAGLGPGTESAVRQALNKPPRIDALRPTEPVVIGRPVELAFRVENAQREVVTITSAAGSQNAYRDLATGRGTVMWVPSAAGTARMRVQVTGLDGTYVADSTTLRVLNPAPTIKLRDPPSRAVVGKPVQFSFEATHALNATVEASTRGGIVFTRRYLIRDGTGNVAWTPRAPGPAVLVVRARGHQGQTVSKRVRIAVAPAPQAPPAPTVTVFKVPSAATVGSPSEIVFQAEGCDVAIARIEGPGEDVQVWRFPCPARKAKFAWTPTRPGGYLMTTTARGSGITTQVETPLSADASRARTNG